MASGVTLRLAHQSSGMDVCDRPHVEPGCSALYVKRRGTNARRRGSQLQAATAAPTLMDCGARSYHCCLNQQARLKQLMIVALAILVLWSPLVGCSEDSRKVTFLFSLSHSAAVLSTQPFCKLLCGDEHFVLL